MSDTEHPTPREALSRLLDALEAAEQKLTEARVEREARPAVKDPEELRREVERWSVAVATVRDLTAMLIEKHGF